MSVSNTAPINHKASQIRTLKVNTNKSKYWQRPQNQKEFNSEKEMHQLKIIKLSLQGNTIYVNPLIEIIKLCFVNSFELKEHRSLWFLLEFKLKGVIIWGENWGKYKSDPEHIQSFRALKRTYGPQFWRKTSEIIRQDFERTRNLHCTLKNLKRRKNPTMS